MSPLGALILIVLVAVLASAPRRWAALALIAGVLFLPQTQSVIIAGINLFSMRILEMVAVARVLSRREHKDIVRTRVDLLLPIFFSYATVIFLLRSDEGFAYQIGLAVDALTCYFSFRALIHDEADIRWLLKMTAGLLIPYTLIVVVESITLENPFSSMGGVAYGGDWMRDGRLRCQGSFRHSSLLGTFGASFFALYLSAAIGRFDRKYAYAGIALCLVIIWACNSGGPISCIANIVFCWILWPLRKHLTLIKRGLLLLGVVMAFFMEAPIFYLPAKVSSLTGGDGWHRSFLMEISFHDLGSWWMFGMPLSNTIDWFPYHTPGTGFADITNQFLAYGIDSGLAAIILFVAVLVAAFREIKIVLSRVANQKKVTHPTAFLTWGLGAALVMHIANWLGIIYFDQTYVIWYLQLAMISSLSNSTRAQKVPLEVKNDEVEVTPIDWARTP